MGFKVLVGTELCIAVSRIDFPEVSSIDNVAEGEGDPAGAFETTCDLGEDFLKGGEGCCGNGVVGEDRASIGIFFGTPFSAC